MQTSTEPTSGVIGRSVSQPRGVKIDLAQKSKERGRARLRLILHRVLVGFGIVFSVVFAVWIAFYSPLFALRADRTVVEGAQSGTVDQAVVDQLVLPSVAKWEGTPLTRLPVGTIKRDLVASSSILDAEVTRAWPKGVRVVLIQRTPVAMVQGEGGYALVGTDGGTVSVVAQPVEELPLIAANGQEAEKIKEQAQIGIAVWQSLPQSLQEQTELVSVNGSVVTLDLATGAKVIWGGSEESDLKSEVLEILVEQAPADTYDLRDPRKPVTS